MTSAKIEQEIKLFDSINSENIEFSLKLNPGRPDLDQVRLIY